MKAQTVSKIGIGSSSLIVINTNTNPINVGFGVVVAGTPTYTVQHTFDNVFAEGFDPASAVWFDHPTITGKTANADGNYAFPIVAVRLTVSAVSVGTDTATLTLIQAGVA